MIFCYCCIVVVHYYSVRQLSLFLLSIDVAIGIRMTKTSSIQKREQLVDHYEKATNTSLVMKIFLNSKIFDVIFDRCINKFMCKLLLW